jgi:hypothetical protein
LLPQSLSIISSIATFFVAMLTAWMVWELRQTRVQSVKPRILPVASGASYTIDFSRDGRWKVWKGASSPGGGDEVGEEKGDVSLFPFKLVNVGFGSAHKVEISIEEEGDGDAAIRSIMRQCPSYRIDREAGHLRIETHASTVAFSTAFAQPNVAYLSPTGSDEASVDVSLNLLPFLLVDLFGVCAGLLDDMQFHRMNLANSGTSKIHVRLAYVSANGKPYSSKTVFTPRIQMVRRDAEGERVSMSFRIQ